MVGLNFVYRRTLVMAGDLAGDGHPRGACCAGVVRVEYAPVVGICRRRRGLAVMPSWALGFWLGRLAPFASMHVSHFVKLAWYATYVDHEFFVSFVQFMPFSCFVFPVSSGRRYMESK